MLVETFRIDQYLRAGEASHIAHKALAPRWPEKAHDHDYFELFLVEQGEADHWINGTRERVARGHLAFVRPGDAHAFRAQAAAGCTIFNVMFRCETVTHLTERYPQDFAGRLFDTGGAVPEAVALQDAPTAGALALCSQVRHGPSTLP